MKKRIIIPSLFALILLIPFITYANDDYDPTQDPNAVVVNSVKCPVLNRKPTYMNTSDYTSVFDEVWVNETDHKVMKPTDVFELGKTYSYRIGYVLRPEFASKFYHFLNFDEHSCQYNLGGDLGDSASDYKTRQIEFYMGNRDEAVWSNDEATLDIDNPAIGGHPTHARSGIKYRINSEKWVNLTDKKDMKNSDVFEVNKKYKYVINYTSFYDTSNFLYNFGGNQYYLGTSLKSSTSINHDIIEGHFYFGDKSTLKIEGTATISNNNTPIAGQTLSIPEVISDAPIDNVSISWYMVDEAHPYGKLISNPSNETVQVGKTYRLAVSLSGEMGYDFENNFKIINNNINENFVSGFEYISNASDYDYQPNSYANYQATYTILEEGATIGINRDSMYMLYPGRGIQLNVYPNNEYNDNVIWKSSDNGIVSVEQSGFIWAMTSGTATITATNSRGDSTSIDIEVGIPVSEIRVEQESLQMYTDDETTLTATVSPDNATDKEVHWSVVPEDEINGDWNDLPARIDYKTGQLTALKPGKAIVRAYTSSSGASADIALTVLKKEINAERIILDKSETKVMVGSTDVLHTIIKPSNATNVPLKWLSSDESVATVDQNGKITAHNIGSAIITVKASSRIHATCIVNVSDFFAVTFYDQDGSSVLKPSTNYEYQTPASEIEKPTNIEKPNYIFVGWYTEPELINKYDFNGIVESKLDLYGKWEEVNVEITTDPISVDYGDVPAEFEERVQRNVTIRNTGNVDVKLNINNPTDSGPFASIAIDNNLVIKPNETYVVKLIAKPGGKYSDTIGTYNGTYRIIGTYIKNNTLKSETNVSATINIVKKPISVKYKTHVQSYGWQEYVKDGALSGTEGEGLRLEAIKVKLTNKDYDGDIEYRSHIQSYGWEKSFKKNDEMSGTSGEGLRLEAIEIKLTDDLETNYDIYYRVHAQTFGWLGWARNGESAGSEGYAKRLEAIQIKIVPKGEVFEGYGEKASFEDKNAPESISLNQTNISIEAGDTTKLIAEVLPADITNKEVTWTSDNEDSVTVDQNGKITAVATGTATVTATTTNGKTATCNVNVLPPIPGVAYKTHVQTYGWQDYVRDGTLSGTMGEAKRIEGIKIKLRNQPYEGDIEYRTHIQTYGWEKTFKKNDEMSGTIGEAKRLEAIEIKLTGEMAEKYDVYYRVHAQTFGWLAWAKNSEKAGTEGYAKRLEAIEIVLVDKDGTPPARNNQNNNQAFIVNNI